MAFILLRHKIPFSHGYHAKGIAFLLATTSLFFFLYHNNIKLQYFNTMTTVTSLHSIASSSPDTKNSDAHLLFVKFHKVGGTTIEKYLKGMFPAKEDKNCTSPNGESCPCHCISHDCSLPVARRMGSLSKEPGLNRAAKLRLLHDSIFGKENKGSTKRTDFNVLTILRDPVERIRSKYYFQRYGPDGGEGWCVKKYGKKCAASELTFLEWMSGENNNASGLMKMGGVDPEACCEYVEILGGGDVDVALSALELFDVVGITEQMNETIAEISKVMGRNATNFPHVFNNAQNKKPWSVEERALAEKLTRKDQIIYRAALKLAESWDSNKDKEKKP